MDIKEQDILGEFIAQHWYYRAKGAAMSRLLAGRKVVRVLDVGAGSGVFSRLLLDRGAVEAVCVDPAYARERVEAHHGGVIRFVRGLERFDGDTVLLMDVLEHVDDDVALLRLYVDMSPPGTRFLITVPAFKFLWSGHDVFLEHRRRYTLGQVERVVAAAGLRPVTGCYYYGVTLPIAAARRLAQRAMGADSTVPRSDLRKHAPLMNMLLWLLCRIELPFFRWNRLAGLTVFCLAEK